MDYAKLKAKAAFYTTYVNELEKQNEDKEKEPFNNRDFINTDNETSVFTSEEYVTIQSLIALGADAFLNPNQERKGYDSIDEFLQCGGAIEAINRSVVNGINLEYLINKVYEHSVAADK